MPVTIGCACGASLRVRDECAGRRVKCPKCAAVVQAPALVTVGAPLEDDGFRIIDEAPASMRVKCPYCAMTLFGSLDICPHCQRALRGAAPTLARERLQTVEEKTAWELGFVLPIIGLAILGNLVNFNPIGLALGCVMFFGLLGRSNGGWWLTVVLSSLGSLGCLLLASMVEVKGAGPILVGVALLYACVVGLLILCRARGAYLRE